MIEHIITNNGVQISTFDSITESDSTDSLLIVPGMLEAAESYFDFFKQVNFFKHILFVSLRGRGKSESPKTGYTLHDHGSDIAAVIQGYGLEDRRLYILGVSMGIPYVLSSIRDFRLNPKGIILIDYPPIYPKLSSQWFEHNVNKNWPVKPEIIQKLYQESERDELVDVISSCNLPFLVLRGMENDSLLPNTLSEKYYSTSNCKVVVIPDAGHDLVRQNNPFVVNEIRKFCCIDETI